MTITSRDILDLISRPYSGGALGRAIYSAKKSRAYGSEAGTTAQREFFEAVQRIRPATTESYVHPETQALPAIGDKSAGLDPAELAWIQRLPQDPAQITFEDAQRLAGLALAFAGPNGARNASSKQLVTSVWRPVKALHDRAAAEVALRNADQPQPALPSAANALADAISAENPTLQPHEVVGRVRQALDDAQARNASERQTAASAARQRITDLDQARSTRSAITH